MLHYNSTTDLYLNPYADHTGINVFIQVWTIIIAIVGTIGNIMIIAAVMLHSHLRKLGNIFIVNLALADLCVSTVVNLASVAGSITSERGIFYRYPWLCELVAIVCMITCTCSLWSIAAIAFNRYVWICHWFQYRKIYNKKTIGIMVAMLWLISFLIDLPNLIGWGGHTFDWKIMSCTGGMSFVYSYAIYFAITAFAVPLFIIAYCYIGIYLFVRKSSMAIDSTRGNSRNPGSTKTRQADIRLAKSVLVIVVVYLAMWSPYSLTVLIDYRVVGHRNLYIIAYTLAHTNSSINCLIYGATNAQFRRGYLHFLRLITCRAKESDLLASVTATATTKRMVKISPTRPSRKTSPLISLDNSRM